MRLAVFLEAHPLRTVASQKVSEAYRTSKEAVVACLAALVEGLWIHQAEAEHLLAMAACLLAITTDLVAVGSCLPAVAACLVAREACQLAKEARLLVLAACLLAVAACQVARVACLTETRRQEASRLANCSGAWAVHLPLHHQSLSRPMMLCRNFFHQQPNPWVPHRDPRWAALVSPIRQDVGRRLSDHAEVLPKDSAQRRRTQNTFDKTSIPRSRLPDTTSVQQVSSGASH
mmetsp:Transcript_47589/g.126131  ORF Transcript_47589/g.126131 Transcript_47589/m.126131 type:complete len:232 (-) Transcript_47589:354-1049(-)